MSTNDVTLAFSAAELEDYLTGELDPDRAETIERAAESDRALADYLAERRAEQEAFKVDARRRPFTALVEEAGAGRSRAWSPRVLGMSLSFALAAAAAIALIARGDGPGIQTKGGLSVQAAVLDDGRPRLFDASSALHPGDRLRLTVDDPSGGYLTVILEESTGAIDVLYRPDELGELPPGSHLLPGSLELDEAVGRERLYVIMSNERPDLEAWTKELRASHDRSGFSHGWLPPRGTRVGTLEYEKVSKK